MPARVHETYGTLTAREINRATLARQMLLSRESVGVLEAVERLAGLQAQWSPAPYIGLWTRLNGFTREMLTERLYDRSIVKATLMRSTLHLVSAKDYPYFDRAIAEARVAVWQGYARGLNVDPAPLHERLLQYAREPRDFDEMVAHVTHDVEIAEDGDDPDRMRRIVWRVAAAGGGLLNALPSGTWGQFRRSKYLAARTWLGHYDEPSLEDALTHLIRRYLAAFGPATRADVLQWSGLRKVAHVDLALHALGDELLAFKSEGTGRNLLYDLATAPRPADDVPAPVRFLPKWDNIILGYQPQDRERVLPRRYQKTVIKVNGDVMQTILVDGRIAGSWAVKRERNKARLVIEPFEPLDVRTHADLEEEGYPLARFIEPDAHAYEVEIAPPREP